MAFSGSGLAEAPPTDPEVQGRVAAPAGSRPGCQAHSQLRFGNQDPAAPRLIHVVAVRSTSAASKLEPQKRHVELPRISTVVDYQLLLFSRHDREPCLKAATVRRVHPSYFRSRQRQNTAVLPSMRNRACLIPGLPGLPGRLASSLLLVVLGFCMVTSPHTPSCRP